MKLLDKNVTVFPYILSGWLQILVKDPSVVPAAAGCSDLALTWPRRCWRLAAPSAMLFGKLNIIYIFNDITSPCPRPLPPLTRPALLGWPISESCKNELRCGPSWNEICRKYLWVALCWKINYGDLCVFRRVLSRGRGWHQQNRYKLWLGPAAGCRPPVSPRTLLLQIEFKLVKVPGWGWWLVLCGLNKHLAIRTHIKIVSSLRTDKHNLGWWWGRVI